MNAQPAKCQDKHLGDAKTLLQMQNGAHTPCGASAVFPQALLVTEGVKAATRCGRVDGGPAQQIYTRVPDCGQFRVRWMSEFCKNYVSGRGWAVSDESKEGPSATGLSAWKYLR